MDETSQQKPATARWFVPSGQAEQEIERAVDDVKRRWRKQLSEGNFVFGGWAGEVRCRHGHPVRLFNIGRGHWAACDTCRTCVFIGSNLMSSWRSENETVWRANGARVRGYKCVDCGETP